MKNRRIRLRPNYVKTVLIAVAAVICLTHAWASHRFEAAAWKNVQTYDVPTLLKQEGSLVNRILAVRFHYRSEKLRHLQPNWYEASIWQHDPNAKKGYSALRVMVAKKDVPAFQTITSNFQSMTETTIYARVEKDAENNQAYLRVLGRKVALDSSGNATVDW